MLARDAADKLKLRKPVALHTPLLGSLSGPGRMDTDAKMSKSNPSGTLLVHDSKKVLTKKLSKAYLATHLIPLTQSSAVEPSLL